MTQDTLATAETPAVRALHRMAEQIRRQGE